MAGYEIKFFVLAVLYWFVIAFGEDCDPESWEFCCGGQAVWNGFDCCDGSPYNPVWETCCDGNVGPGDSCCGTEDPVPYDSSWQMCCDDTPYNPAWQACCNGNVGAGDTCCGTEPYFTGWQMCCDGTVSAGSADSCCGGQPFDSRYEVCCSEQMGPHEGDTCCGELEYWAMAVASSFICCDSVFGYGTQCCGDTPWNPEDLQGFICCDGNLGWGDACCEDEPYNTEWWICCDDGLRFKSPFNSGGNC